MKNKGFDQEYKNWLREIKEKIKGAQIRAALSANRELLDFYYDLGRMITEKDSIWGSRFLEILSIDLKSPSNAGFFCYKSDIAVCFLNIF